MENENCDRYTPFCSDRNYFFLGIYSYLTSLIVLNSREMDSLYNNWYWVVMGVLFLHIYRLSV